MKLKWFVRQRGFTSGPLSFRDLINELVTLDDWRTVQIKHGEMKSWIFGHQLELLAARPEVRRGWLGSLALIVSGAVLGALLVLPITWWLPAQLKEAADPGLRQRTAIASKLLKAKDGLPKKIDQYAIRTDISYKDPEMTFSNILLLRSADVSDSDRTDISRAVIKNTCAFPQTREFMTAGGKITFNYADVEAQPFTTIQVAEQSCF